MKNHLDQYTEDKFCIFGSCLCLFDGGVQCCQTMHPLILSIQIKFTTMSTRNTKVPPASNMKKVRAKAEKQERYNRKNRIKKMPIWKKVLAYAVAPLFFAMWIIDRSIHLLFPHSDHPKFKHYMLDMNNLWYTFIRILIFGIPALIIAWIF